MHRSLPLFLILAALFALGTQRLSHLPPRLPAADTLVAMPPVLLLGLYGGDRHLAANLESARLMVADAENAPAAGLRYYQQAHAAISSLNPCHEDNYYVANSILAWGGAQTEAFRILQRATDCRFWDDWPAFFYGYNQLYFNQDAATAARYMQLAADRHGENRLMFQRLAITLQARGLGTKQAIAFLQAQQQSSRDARLRRSLGYRIERLQGLLQLEDAGASYQQRFGHPLRQAQDLLKTGILPAFPQDPLGLGYTFDPDTARFGLKTLDQRATDHAGH